MTLEESRTNSSEQDFLILNYTEIDFFVNRNQFSGSTSLDKLGKVKSTLPYITHVFSYNKQRILLLNCDAFLKDTYNCQSKNDSQLCLLMSLENFSKKNHALIRKLLSHEGISSEYLGLRITSQSEISKLNISEIYLSPIGIRSLLHNCGLYGCRFPEENRIQFFIDLETIIINIIKGKNR